MENNKNTLYVVIALLVGLILGYMVSNSGIITSKQTGQAISSDYDLNKSKNNEVFSIKSSTSKVLYVAKSTKGSKPMVSEKITKSLPFDIDQKIKNILNNNGNEPSSSQLSEVVGVLSQEVSASNGSGDQVYCTSQTYCIEGPDGQGYGYATYFCDDGTGGTTGQFPCDGE